MDLQRITVKVLAETADDFDILESVPVFHQWIKDGTVGDLLLDVADYAHVPEGPGIMLLADEGHYGLDNLDSELGMRYARKRHLDGTVGDRIQKALHVTLVACQQLEKDLPGRIFFPGKSLTIAFDDRLAVPNSSEGEAVVLDDLKSVVGQLYPDGGVSVTCISGDEPRNALTFAVQVEGDVSLDELVKRAEAQPISN